jgi:ABC-2 type transport system permease protein
MRAFLVRLGWELFRLLMRPGMWLAFALSLALEICVSMLLKIPDVRAAIARDVWKMRAHWSEVFSGLTTAAHMLGETFAVVGALGASLAAAEIVAGENESGALRMIFCRSAGRGSVLAVKGIASAFYTILLTTFIWAGALTVGLIFEGPGNLMLLAPHEGVMGVFTFEEGLRRYVLALPLIWLSALSAMLWPFWFSCTRMKPAACAVLALALFATDNLVRTTPQTVFAAPYCVSTRLLSWRQVFNDEIPWPRIRRNYTQLALLDTALIAMAWAAFRRLEFRR